MFVPALDSWNTCRMIRAVVQAARRGSDILILKNGDEMSFRFVNGSPRLRRRTFCRRISYPMPSDGSALAARGRRASLRTSLSFCSVVDGRQAACSVLRITNLASLVRQSSESFRVHRDLDPMAAARSRATQRAVGRVSCQAVPFLRSGASKALEPGARTSEVDFKVRLQSAEALKVDVRDDLGLANGSSRDRTVGRQRDYEKPLDIPTFYPQRSSRVVEQSKMDGPVLPPLARL